MLRIKGRKRNNLLFSWLSVFILAAISVLLLFAVIESGGKYKQTREERQAAAAGLAGLEKEKAVLEEKLSQLSTEEGIEENIRDRFLVAKEGEEVIVIVEDESESEKDKNKGQGFFVWLRDMLGL